MKEKIKNFLKKNWLKTIILIIIMIIIGGAFYWYKWKPQEIRKQCWERVKDTIKDKDVPTIDVQRLLDICLIGSGLDK